MKKNQGSQVSSQQETTNDTYHVEITTEQVGYESDDKEWGWTETWHQKTLKPYLYPENVFKKNNVFFSYPDTIECPKEYFKGETSAWLVWAEYSTGSTFGRQHSSCHALIAIFKLKDYAAAQDLVNYVETIDTIGSKPYTTLDGQKLKIYPSWAGYFERLEKVHIDRVTVDDDYTNTL